MSTPTVPEPGHGDPSMSRVSGTDPALQEAETAAARERTRRTPQATRLQSAWDKERIVLAALRGESYRTMAQEYGVTEDEIRGWTRSFRRGGRTALRPRPTEDVWTALRAIRDRVGALETEVARLVRVMAQREVRRSTARPGRKPDRSDAEVAAVLSGVLSACPGEGWSRNRVHRLLRDAHQMRIGKVRVARLLAEAARAVKGKTPRV